MCYFPMLILLHHATVRELKTLSRRVSMTKLLDVGALAPTFTATPTDAAAIAVVCLSVTCTAAITSPILEEAMTGERGATIGIIGRTVVEKELICASMILGLH